MAPQTQQPEQELGPALDVLEILSLGIARFRWWIIPFALIGLISGAAVALIQVNTYTSSAEIWVDWNADDSVSPSSQMGIESSRQPGKTGWTVRAELSLLLTSVLDEMIVREVGIERLTRSVDPRQFDHAGTPPLTRWQHNAQFWWLNRNKKPTQPGEEAQPAINFDSPKGLAAAISKLGRIRISPKVGSDNIILIKTAARSPELAQDIVAATANSIMARHEQIFSRSQTDEFATEMVERYESEEKDYKSILSLHRDDCGFFDIERMEPILQDKQTKTEDRLDGFADELIENGEELRRSKKELPNVAQKITVTVEEKLGNNPAYDEVRRNIQVLQGKREKIKRVDAGAAMTAALEVIDADIKIQETYLQDLPPQIVVSKKHDEEQINPDYTKLKDRIGELELRVDQVLKLQARHQKRLEKTREELRLLEACKPTHSDMKEDIFEATGLLRKIGREQSNRRISDLMAESGFKNIKIIEEPSYIPAKFKPDRGITILMGLGIGAGVGILFCLIRQLLDGKFRYPKSVATCLGVPVLGVIPEQRKWRKLGRQLQDKSA